MRFIIATVVGMFAVATFLLSYQQKKRKNIILWNVVSRCLYVVQYVLLGAYSGAVLDVLGAAVSIVAERKDHPRIARHIKTVVIACNLVIVAVGLLLYENVFSLLPIAGVLLHTGAFWLRDEHARRDRQAERLARHFAAKRVAGVIMQPVGFPRMPTV